MPVLPRWQCSRSLEWQQTGFTACNASCSREVRHSYVIMKYHPDERRPNKQHIYASCLNDNWLKSKLAPSLVGGLCEVCVSSAEEAYALYETCSDTMKTSPGSISSRYVKESLNMQSIQWNTLDLFSWFKSITVAGLTGQLNNTFLLWSNWDTMLVGPFGNLWMNEPVRCSWYVFSPQMQLPVLSGCRVETLSRAGGVGCLPKQIAAVQSGRRSQQDWPQRVSVLSRRN